MKILIDNGHGVDTKGKRSPDGRLLEYKWSREIAKMICDKLKRLGYDAVRITPEEEDLNLPERVKRVNRYCSKLGAGNVVLVSIHTDAAGSDGKWYGARGFSSRVFTTCYQKSKDLSRILWEEAIEHGLQGNRSIPTDKYVPQNLYLLKWSKCVAVLTESGFHDNKEDVELLLSDTGKEKVVDTHVKALIKYIKKYEK